MKLTDIHNRETDIRDADHLEMLLTETPGIDGHDAFVISSTAGEPEFWLSCNKEIAYPHFFLTTDGSHPGYQPESVDRLEHEGLPETVIFFQVGASLSDQIEMPRRTTVAKLTAINAARQFLKDQRLPTTILWFEL